MMPGLWQIVIVAVVVILLFGKGRMSSVMEDLAKGISAFKKGLREEDAPKAVERQKHDD